MGIQLTAMGALAAFLWILAGTWEFSLPQGVEKKLINWRSNQYSSQIIIRFIAQESIFMQERFAFSLKGFLRDMQDQIGIPVHCEIKLIKEGEPPTEEELHYIRCLNRSFGDFTWRIQENQDDYQG
ncbi:MAG: hypothetical protein GX958_09455 [Desulfitobacterium sp.]|nr:hypothetical protein [Desulfitobacterium sp.]